MNLRVTKGHILASILDEENEIGGIISNVKQDTVEAEVFAVGHDITDIKKGDIIVAPKGRTILTMQDHTEYNIFEYDRIFIIKTKDHE